MYHSTMATDGLATKHRHLSFEYYTVIRRNKETLQQKIISKVWEGGDRCGVPVL